MSILAPQPGDVCYGTFPTRTGGAMTHYAIVLAEDGDDFLIAVGTSKKIPSDDGLRRWEFAVRPGTQWFRTTGFKEPTAFNLRERVFWVERSKMAKAERLGTVSDNEALLRRLRAAVTAANFMPMKTPR